MRLKQPLWLRRCSVSAGGVVARDEMVFNAALQRRVPIAMCLSGGYARDGHRVITQSIANLLRAFRLAPGARNPNTGASGSGAAGAGRAEECPAGAATNGVGSEHS